MKKTAQTLLRDGGTYTIAAANGRVLEVADFNTENGAAVRLWSYAGEPWQQWCFEEAGEGEYRIRNRFTGKVMDLAMRGKSDGTWIHQWMQTSGLSQHWQPVPAAEGGYRLRNVYADKVLDLVDMRLDNGAQAQIWKDVGGENQTWRIMPVPEKQLKEVTEVPHQAAPRVTRTQTGRGSRAKKEIDRHGRG